jgi:micrococcal nuclease
VRNSGSTLNEDLVRNGLAWWYQKYSHDRKLSELELRARKEKVWLWSEATPQPPWEFRKERRVRI